MKARVEEEVLRDRSAVQTPMMEKKWQGQEVYLGVPSSSPRLGLQETVPSKAGVKAKP